MARILTPIGLKASRPSGVWTYPVETVSQSEGGFELVHQSVAVVPHWMVEADASGESAAENVPLSDADSPGGIKRALSA